MNAPPIRQRIAFISTMNGEPWGGSEELWSQSAGRLLGEGWDVSVRVRRWENEPSKIQSLRKGGARIVHEDWVPPRSIVERVRRRLHPAQAFQWLDQFAPELAVISQGANWEGYEWGEICSARNIPYVLVSQSAMPWFWPPDSVLTRVREAHRRAKACYFVSNANRELTETQLAMRLNNAEVIRNPFGVAYQQPQKWPASSEWRFACVAALEPRQKAQELLFSVLQSPQWSSRPAKVTLYGRGSFERGLRGLASQMQLSMVDFAGFVAPTEIWSKNHILVLTSRHEGLPLALVEAMLSGRPAVVTDVGGNREVLEDGVTGFIADAPTVPSISAALERAWVARDQWPAMGAEAARRIRELVPNDPIGVFVEKIKHHAGQIEPVQDVSRVQEKSADVPAKAEV